MAMAVHSRGQALQPTIVTNAAPTEAISSASATLAAAQRDLRLRVADLARRKSAMSKHHRAARQQRAEEQAKRAATTARVQPIKQPVSTYHAAPIRTTPVKHTAPPLEPPQSLDVCDPVNETC